MQSLSNLVKKKRRYSGEQISFQAIPLKSLQSSDLASSLKFQKLQNRKAQSRKSMQLERIKKCSQKIDNIKRQTQWSKAKFDQIQFQQILQRKKQQKLNFKFADLKSIQHRSLNSFIQTDMMQSSAFDFNFVQRQKRFSLVKQANQVAQFQKELKRLNQRQVEEKTKNRMLQDLIFYLNTEIATQQQKAMKQDRYLSQGEKYYRALKKQQQKTDFFIRSTNQIHQKILRYQKEIFSLRSQRVVYSSIFKQLEKQIKHSQNYYKQLLIYQIQFMQTVFLQKMHANGAHYGQDFQRSQGPMNSFMEYKNLFTNILRATGVKFMTIHQMNDEEQLHDKINSHTAINYYTQSRKVIILPRYKEHYQSSRKKIKLEKQENSFEQLTGQFVRLLQALQLTDEFEGSVGNSVTTSEKSDKPGDSLHSTCKQKSKTILKWPNDKKKQQFEKTNCFFTKKFLSFDKTGQCLQTILEKVKSLVTQIPIENKSLFKDIQEVNVEIQKAYRQIQNQHEKLKVFKSSNMFGQKNHAQNQQNESMNLNSAEELKQLQSIKKLFSLQQNDSQNYLIERLRKLEEFYLCTKTVNIFQKQEQVQNQNQVNVQPNDLDTDRSNISIKFKKVDQNKIIENNDKKDIVTRGPKTLNAILKNIQVYDSYERAFERMDFEKQYEIEKNRKKRTLVRRDGMVSLGLLKAQQKMRPLKRKSSNKKQN